MKFTYIKRVDEPDSNTTLTINDTYLDVGNVIEITGGEYTGKYIVTGNSSQNRAQRRADQFNKKINFERYYLRY